MKLSLFDLHCDTAYEMHRQGQALQSNFLAVSLGGAKKLDHYIQVMAHWTDKSLDNESGWQALEAILQGLKNDPALLSGAARIITKCSTQDLGIPSLLLAVEDARILNGRLDRVDQLYALGFRILTPLWQGETCIGGSHDTQVGLTAFGVSALTRAASLGMILDLSHASERSAEQMLEISGVLARPVIASHSNAYDVCPVSRNLRREQIKAILQSGGIIGLNLHTPFLKKDAEAHACDLLAHIAYFLEQGCEAHLALGCDMDGCTLPPEIPTIAHLLDLAELLLRQGCSEELIHRIFYQNAYSFAQKHLA